MPPCTDGSCTLPRLGAGGGTLQEHKPQVKEKVTRVRLSLIAPPMGSRWRGNDGDGGTGDSLVAPADAGVQGRHAEAVPWVLDAGLRRHDGGGWWFVPPSPSLWPGLTGRSMPLAERRAERLAEWIAGSGPAMTVAGMGVTPKAVMRGLDPRILLGASR